MRLAAPDGEPRRTTKLPPLADADGNLPQLYEELVRKVFARELKAGDIDIPTAVDTARTLMHGVFKGAGGDFSGIAYNSPHYNMLANLEKNVYQFSAAKNYQQLKDLTLALKDGDRVRTRAEFRKEAAKILGEYNAYLDTEYNTAVSGAANAGKWVDYVKDAAIMPNLKYVTVGDARVRDEHRALHGVIRAITDVFWKQYYPPNGWNCRCTVLQVAGDAQPTAEKDIVYPDVPKMFRVNLAQQGLIFPQGHPYYKGLPDSVKTEAFHMLPYERQFETIYEGKGKSNLGLRGTVSRHIDVDTDAADYRLHEAIAKEKANNGAHVEILPIVDDHETVIRKAMLKNVKENKNPDLRINGHYVEVKEPTLPLSASRIDQNIRNAAKQADRVIINLLSEVDEHIMYRLVKSRFMLHEELEVVEFRYKKKYFSFKRAETIKKG